ncbi:MAG: bile acid:sodium symporter family protein [Chloroflexi bacterium]|nr:bile acid:sodium symporter family protein [Chloroflexota bacterium]
MSEILQVLMNLSVLVFVITSMLAMGLNLTVKQIVEPLRNTRLVILALVANFVLIPILAYLILAVIKLDQGLATGLILMATAAGAPFLPKLAQAAKGNMAFSVGLMVLLMIVTIVYMPLVLPLLLQGVEVNPLEIARSLIIMMLIPLAIGLFVKARYESIAESLQPHMSQTSTVAIAILMVTGLVLNWQAIVGVLGTGTIIAIAVFLLGALAIGYFLGGKDAGIRSVLGLGTAQRNLAAALVVAAQNFADDPNVITMILVAGLVGLVLLMVVGGELGKRATA